MTKYSFGHESKKRLGNVHPVLVTVLYEVLNYMDIKVLSGYRGKDEQNSLYPHATKVKYPNSKHNTSPSLAVDVAPYPVNWIDRERFSYMAGLIIGIGAKYGLELRWGGDWDMDGEIGDNKFDDLGHIEVVSVNGKYK